MKIPSFALLRRHLCSGIILVLSIAGLAAAASLKINGSTTVNLPVAEGAEILRAEKGMDIQVDTQAGSSGGISMLGEGLVQLGMSSKHVSADDKAKFPRCNYKEIIPLWRNLFRCQECEAPCCSRR